MDETTHETARHTGVCPMNAMHALHAQPARLERDTELFFPMHKRVIAQYATSGSGATELILYYGDKEISFDEPDLFAFGETLAQQSHFAAGHAASWGEGYGWLRIRELLEQLLDAGVLQYAHESEPAPIASRDGARPSPLPPAVTATPRTWFECEAITRELTGRPLELGYLELVVPVFRVAHMALDADGRQVGEANVFPKPLRLDVPTKWRTCIYAGSRFQTERPMNVTALKTMRVHWPQVMTALGRVREAYLQRFPLAPSGWSVADVERLSTLVLAAATYPLVRSEGRVGNGELHPALSSIFRVTDGLRMVMHQMLFVPVAEATLAPDTPIGSAAIYAYAERNHAFHSTYGVCAGPKAMIEEFLSVLVDGAPPRDHTPVVLDSALEAELALLDPAFDYGLYGLQAHAVLFSLWPVMTRTYDRLWRIVQSCADEGSDTLARLHEHLQDTMQKLENGSLHATEEWRVNRERVYAHLYAHCFVGAKPEQTLEERIALAHQPRDPQLEQRLRDILHRQLPSASSAQHDALESIVECLAGYFIQAKAILGLACEIQDRINALLGRAPPARPFSAADIDVHILLQGDEARRLPYLIDALEALLGLRVEITKDVIAISETNTSQTIGIG